MKVRLETGTDLYLTRVGRISGGIGRIGPVPGLQSSLADTVSYHESQTTPRIRQSTTYYVFCWWFRVTAECLPDRRQPRQGAAGLPQFKHLESGEEFPGLLGASQEGEPIQPGRQVRTLQGSK